RLAENFRSHPALLEFVNRVFSAVMRPEVGGVDYDPEAQLIPGTAPKTATLQASGNSVEPSTEPRVELHLRLKLREDDRGDLDREAGSLGQVDPEAILDEELEARLVARRLRELQAERWPIWDAAAHTRRPVEWRDMVVLLRSPRSKAESYAKEFARQAVPLVASRGGFYDGTEITDLLGVLQLLDNPLQDVPLLAVLRSPIVGLTVNDLAAIRLTTRAGGFWTALRRFHASAPAAPAWPAVDLFLQRFGRWRELARRGALSRCLETVLDQTGYLDWLAIQPRGQMRCANVRRLVAMTRQFDRLQRQGLFRFLKSVEAQQAAELETEPLAFGSENAVRLMSIHQAKGLEFPVLVVADLGKPFNLDDLKQDLILDEEYGLGLMVRSPRPGLCYPSLPCWLARQRLRQETLGEELRLLYVAMTRAADRLILAGTAWKKTAAEKWHTPDPGRLSPAEILAARTTLDWLGPLLPALTERSDWLERSTGHARLLAWRLYAAGEDQVERGGAAHEEGRQGSGQADPAPQRELGTARLDLVALRTRLQWRYPHVAATLEPAKTSVSALRRRLADESDAEARLLFPAWTPPLAGAPVTRAESTRATLSAAEIGTAHHVFLQYVSFVCPGDPGTFELEAARLEQTGVLEPAERESLDFEALAAFWSSALGRKFRARAAQLHRELPFTARFQPAELAALNLCPDRAGLEAEFVVVQGVVDWAAILPDAIWVLDFKTDQVQAGEAAAKVNRYTPQLRLYAAALERIHRRPVTELWLHFLPQRRSVSLL
ncbi:MAG: PD-(D/E)XK nuclease family protein, partial [Verrucomicrobia bacterium]|nr:PD-(D/E)XK nuclease family protein [Verrucomicrobiota bacterium]